MVEQLPIEKQQLVVDNLNLIHYILKHYFHMNPYRSDYEDYFQEGCIGLILSAIRFDESRGFQFSTYASSMIQGQIRRYKRDKDNIIKIPRDKYNMLMKVIQLTTQGMTIDDIVEMTGYSYEDIYDCIQLGNIDSLDRDISDETSDRKSITMYETIGDTGIDLEEVLSIDHITDCVEYVKSKLTQDLYRDIWEEYVWAMYYGEKLNQQYFGNKYGVSQAQVSRILKKCKKLFATALVEEK